MDPSAMITVVALIVLTGLILWLIGYLRNIRRHRRQLKLELRDAEKVRALVIAVESSTSAATKRNLLCIQLLLRARLQDGTLEEGMAIWNIPPRHFRNVQPGSAVAALYNRKTQRFFPDEPWALYNATLGSMLEKQVAGKTTTLHQ